jgi:hypothetical protein
MRGNPLFTHEHDSEHWRAMLTPNLKSEYLAKAREAEDQAEKAKGDSAKSAWLRIAAGYHDLAARQDRR